MSQSREDSALEVVTGAIIGFAVSVVAPRLQFASLGHDLLPPENALVSSSFTALALVCAYVLRRMFNKFEGR